MSLGAPNRILCALSALAGALVLAACGGGSDSGDSGTGDGSDVFNTAALQKTLDAVKADAGEDAQLLRVQLTIAGTDFQIADGDQATGLHYAPGSDDGQDVDVELIGTGSVAENSFPISEVDPAAIDKMLDGAPETIGADDFKPTAMTLELGFNGEAGWTINGDGGGRTSLVLQAAPDGTDLTTPGGTVPGGTDTGDGTATGAETPVTPAPSGEADPAAIAECVQNANGDITKIQACATQ